MVLFLGWGGGFVQREEEDKGKRKDEGEEKIEEEGEENGSVMK